MIERVRVPVTVEFVSDHKLRRVRPKTVWWEGKAYQIIKLGLHHSFRQGKTLIHVFSVASREIYFRLALNTETLLWQLEEIADGLPG